MIYNDHSNLAGKHALLSPSQPAWLNYDDEEKLLKKMKAQWATTVGTIVHEWCENRINFRMKVNKYQKSDLLFYLLKNKVPEYAFDLDAIFENAMLYINDGIGFKMDAEQILYYSDNCFGTADTICFRNNVLRIHDLKTGTGPVHIEQLLTYVALFCLEYRIKPADIDAELRIYQTNNDVICYKPTVEDIVPIIDQIISLDKALKKIQA